MTSSVPEPVYRDDFQKERLRILRRNTMRMAMFLLCTVLMVKKANAEQVTEANNVTTNGFVAAELRSSITSKDAFSSGDDILVQARGEHVSAAELKHYKPYFDDRIDLNVTTQLTKTAYLHCTIHQLGDKTVSWVRQKDLHILTVGKYTYTTDSRFTSIHLDDTDNWTLEIRDTRKLDEGTYECQVSTEPKMSLAILLNILADAESAENPDQESYPSAEAESVKYPDQESKPSVVEAKISEGRSLYLKTGSPINLTCQVTNEIGTVYMFWYHDGRVLDEGDKKNRGIEVFTEYGTTSTSRLFIAKAKESDSGNYTCHPSYAVPATITLEVLDGEKPAAMQHDRNDAVSIAASAFVALLVVAFLM